MSFFTKVFWETLWQDKKMMIIVIGIILAIILAFVGYKVVAYKIQRSWNWNMGGYESRTVETICEMAKKGAIEKGPNYAKLCK